MYNNYTKQLEKTKKFKEKLEKIFPAIKVESVDERYTSFEADNILKTL
ncbi:MAG: Holliday junction resolvase RuvX [Candidatus Peribacteria bacterium]|nr:Holliday junction resolvase RuvX [Candidatus Peribacteria bacterium]